MARLRKAAAPLLAMAALSTPAMAQQVDRQEIAEAFDTEVPRETYAYCQDTQLFTMADGSEYRACVDWRAQTRTRLIRTYAVLDGPPGDSDANLAAARDCFDIAVASQNDPYREAFDADRFLAGARSVFRDCATRRGLARGDTYTLSISNVGVWSGGSRPDANRGYSQ